MINTHIIMGENIIKFADKKNLYLVKKRFIWGNVKPDCTPKYKKVKHYYNESIDMVVDKITYLASLSQDEVYNKITIGKFSEELGVVCHFLCDFFTAPHYYRWEFKSTKAVKHHMLFENKLAKAIKKYNPIRTTTTDLKVGDVREFICKLQESYAGKIDCEHDLYYAYYVCDNIVNMIISEVFINNKKDIAL